MKSTVVIPISGVIGLDILPKDVRSQLNAANGAPVEVQLASPGGLVEESLEIFSLIKNYPGPTTTHLMGMAASAASYIACAGDRITAEGNAIFMIHNSSGGALGTSEDLRAAASILDGLNNIMAEAYARKSGRMLDEIHALMDAETFFFGSEARDANFVDEIRGEPSPMGAKPLALARARIEASACEERLSRIKDRPLARVAACLKIPPTPRDIQPPKPRATVAELSKRSGMRPESVAMMERAYPGLLGRALGN